MQHMGSRQILARQCCLEEGRSVGPPASCAAECRGAWGWRDKSGKKTPQTTQQPLNGSIFLCKENMHTHYATPGKLAGFPYSENTVIRCLLV